MATSASSSYLLLPPLSNPSSSSYNKTPFSSPYFHSQNNNKTLSIKPSNNKKLQNLNKPTTFLAKALAESSSSADSLTPLLQNISDSFAQLPPDFLGQLPNDLRLDLNDAAFDLSNGPVIDEALTCHLPEPMEELGDFSRLCGRELGEVLLNLSRAWEVADTSTSSSIAKKLPSLADTLSDNAKSALGKRLVSSGRRFQSMGSYGQGELQRIAKVMIETGKLLSAIPLTDTDERPQVTSRMFKFGELQVALTPDKAYIGAAISVVFGIISWELAQGIQSIPESSLQYANDNALVLGKSLRGALLATGYASAILSAFATVGLILLGRDLSSEK